MIHGAMAKVWVSSTSYNAPAAEVEAQADERAGSFGYFSTSISTGKLRVSGNVRSRMIAAVLTLRQ